MNKTTFSTNDIIPFENDELRNSSDEVEDRWAILKYDPVLLDSTYSYGNESYYVDENNEYIEPTSYDSPFDVGVGYNSIDEHVHFHNTINDDEHLD